MALSLVNEARNHMICCPLALQTYKHSKLLIKSVKLSNFARNIAVIILARAFYKRLYLTDLHHLQ